MDHGRFSNTKMWLLAKAPKHTHTKSTMGILKKIIGTLTSLYITLHSSGAMSLSSKVHSKERIQWQVRPAKPEDSIAVNKLLLSSYSELLPSDYSEDILKEAIPKMTTASEELLTCRTWYVVEHPEAKHIVGCGGWTKRKPGNDPEASTGRNPPHLRHFGTDPKQIRRGIGRAIWDQIQKDLKADPELSEGTELEVFSTLTAESFYASLGFITVEHTTVALSGNCMFPCILMRRPALDAVEMGAEILE